MKKRLQSVMAILALFTVLVAVVPAQAQHSATLLLEEPYGKLGFFTGTGHAAVYLSGVCAQTPLILRTCKPGELGTVISRYNGVGHFDWVAIPLIPYLYAVERAEDIPLFADASMVSFLRDRYRREHLEAVAPDLADGSTPGGNWYELVGTSYDRTVYGFTVETTEQKDEALIRKYNAQPNRSHFRTVSNNCADFVKDVINFYYPKTLHRSVISDIGITTPKQMAKLMVRFGDRHPELQFSRVVIVQVPGSLARSTTAHNVVESFFKQKKYIVPSALVSPIFAASVAAVYVGSGTGRFEPARNAMIFRPGSDPDLPLGREDRRAYQKELASLRSENSRKSSFIRADKAWGHLQSKASIEVDDDGRPILQMKHGDELVSVGASAENILNTGAPRELVQQLLAARLQEELRHDNPPRVSGRELARDWRLLQHTLEEKDDRLSTESRLEAHEAQAPTRGPRSRGNQQ